MHQPIFVGGCERSGTTLLRVILDSHSNIHCGPEAKIVAMTVPCWTHQRNSNSKVLREYYHFTDAKIDALYRDIITTAISRDNAVKKKWLAEKSPQNVFYYSQIRALFPESPIVNIVRDGRDVVASLLEMDWTNNQGKRLAFTVDIEAACRRWLAAVEANAFFAASNNAQPYVQICYEDLVTNPKAVISDLLNLLGEPWEDDLLSFHTIDRNLGDESSAGSVQNKIAANRIGRWKGKFSSDEKTLLHKLLGVRLTELGYDA
jgi:hypothetical protein